MTTQFSKITVDSIGESFKEGLEQAQLRQTVTRSLPSVRTSNSLKGNIFSDEELGIKSNDYTEVRVAWMEVKKGMTKEFVQAAIDKQPTAKLRRFLASQIILSDDQKLVYANGLSGAALVSFNKKYGIAEATSWGTKHVTFFLNNIAERQVVRYGENTDGKSPEEIVLYNGKQQFRRCELSPEGGEDVDLRIKQEVVDIKDIALAPTEKAKVSEETVK